MRTTVWPEHSCACGERPASPAARPRAESETLMKKEHKNLDTPEMRDEYDFSQGVRGKYADRFAKGTNLVLLDADVAKVFPTAESVNCALRALADAAMRSTTDPSSRQ